MRARTKYPKPVVPKGFPLTWDAGTGVWVKTVGGKKRRMGKRPDGASPQKALKFYQDNRVYWEAGMEPPEEVGEGATVRDVANKFMKYHEGRMKAGQVTPGTYKDLERHVGFLVAAIGSLRCTEITADHGVMVFDKVAEWSSRSAQRRKALTNIRSVLKYAREVCGLAVRSLGPACKLEPMRTVLRKSQYDNTCSLLEPEDVRTVVRCSKGYMRACLLLGLNSGFYAKSCSDLRRGDIAGNVLSNIRRKRMTERFCWLWDETLAAIEMATTANKPDGRLLLSTTKTVLVEDNPGADVRCPSCGHVFSVTRFMSCATILCPKCKKFAKRNSVRTLRVRSGKKNLVNEAWSRLAKLTGLQGSGKTFKSLRHTFTTVAQRADVPGNIDGFTKQQAIDAANGHEGAFDVREHYDHNDPAVQMSRMVVEHVYDWAGLKQLCLPAGHSMFGK